MLIELSIKYFMQKLQPPCQHWEEILQQHYI